MRRSLLLICILICSALLFATESDPKSVVPEYSGETISEANNATAQFSFDLTSYMKVVVGFKETEESTGFLTDENIVLMPSDGFTATTNVVLAWDIITSNNNVVIRLEPDGKIRANENSEKLDWSVTSSDGTKTYFDTSITESETTSGNSDETNIVDIGFESGKGRYEGSETLAIATGSYANLSFDSDYFANLRVVITT